jgi:hypothetical protein
MPDQEIPSTRRFDALSVVRARVREVVLQTDGERLPSFLPIMKLIINSRVINSEAAKAVTTWEISIH